MDLGEQIPRLKSSLPQEHLDRANGKHLDIETIFDEVVESILENSVSLINDDPLENILRINAWIHQELRDNKSIDSSFYEFFLHEYFLGETLKLLLGYRYIPTLKLSANASSIIIKVPEQNDDNELEDNYRFTYIEPFSGIGINSSKERIINGSIPDFTYALINTRSPNNDLDKLIDEKAEAPPTELNIPSPRKRNFGLPEDTGFPVKLLLYLSKYLEVSLEDEVKYYREIIRILPETFGIRVDLANLLSEEGNHEETIKLLEEEEKLLQQLGKNTSNVQTLLAVEHILISQPGHISEEAHKYLEDLQTNPDALEDPTFYYAKGLTSEKSGNLIDALSKYNQSLEKKKTPRVILRKARLFIKMHKKSNRKPHELEPQDEKDYARMALDTYLESFNTTRKIRQSLVEEAIDFAYESGEFKFIEHIRSLNVSTHTHVVEILDQTKITSIVRRAHTLGKHSQLDILLRSLDSLRKYKGEDLPLIPNIISLTRLLDIYENGDSGNLYKMATQMRSKYLGERSSYYLRYVIEDFLWFLNEQYENNKKEQSLDPPSELAAKEDKPAHPLYDKITNLFDSINEFNNNEHTLEKALEAFTLFRKEVVSFSEEQSELENICLEIHLDFMQKLILRMSSEIQKLEREKQEKEKKWNDFLSSVGITDTNN